MAVTNAQKRATTKYEHSAYEKITVRIKTPASGQYQGDISRQQIADAADAAGESVNEYIINAVKLRMNGVINIPNEPEKQVEVPNDEPFTEEVTYEQAEDAPWPIKFDTLS